MARSLSPLLFCRSYKQAGHEKLTWFCIGELSLGNVTKSCTVLWQQIRAWKEHEFLAPILQVRTLYLSEALSSPGLTVLSDVILKQKLYIQAFCHRMCGLIAPALLGQVYPVKCQTALSFFRTGAEDTENLQKRLGFLQDQTAHHTNIPSGPSVREGGGSLYLPSQEGGQKDQASARPSDFCCSRVHFRRK